MWPPISPSFKNGCAQRCNLDFETAVKIRGVKLLLRLNLKFSQNYIFFEIFLSQISCMRSWGIVVVFLIFNFCLPNSARCKYFYTARRRRKKFGVFFASKRCQLYTFIEKLPFTHICTLPASYEKQLRCFVFVSKRYKLYTLFLQCPPQAKTN